MYEWLEPQFSILAPLQKVTWWQVSSAVGAAEMQLSMFWL